MIRYRISDTLHVRLLRHIDRKPLSWYARVFWIVGRRRGRGLLGIGIGLGLRVRVRVRVWVWVWVRGLGV